MRFRKVIVTIVLFVGAIVFGWLIGSMCSEVAPLSWLGYSVGFGIPSSNPFVLDIAILQLTLGFYVSINVAQIILLTIAIFMYKPMLKKL